MGIPQGLVRRRASSDTYFDIPCYAKNKICQQPLKFDIDVTQASDLRPNLPLNTAFRRIVSIIVG